MLAMRAGERTNIMSEAGRCEGRALAGYRDGPTGAPCIQMGSFNCPFQGEEELHAGYLTLRLPAMCEGASRVRTSVATSAMRGSSGLRRGGPEGGSMSRV